MDLQDRKILYGVTGGIAAYKAPLVLRALKKQGADVRVVLTQSAQKFVTSATLEVLSKHRVHVDLFDYSPEFSVVHVDLAHWAELILVAPATANSIGKWACGLADDLLSCLVLSAAAPLMVAAAMEEKMLDHPAVQNNKRLLVERGAMWIEPETGELASGAVGKGRMAAPETVVARVVDHFKPRTDFSGWRLVVTAGPTVEDIDPVRFIGNRSSGKMGYALARRAQERGAEVWLVSGPTALEPPVGVHYREVRSTLAMKAAVDDLFDRANAAILAAAVADYRSASVAPQKIKRGTGALQLELVENPDIAAELGKRKGKRLLVGFAMETEQGLERAKEKLRRKNCDLMALNDLTQEGAGFGVDTNILTLIDAAGHIEELPKMSKLEAADRILDRLQKLAKSQT